MAAILLATSAQADPVQQIQRWLWPHYYRPAPEVPRETLRDPVPVVPVEVPAEVVPVAPPLQRPAVTDPPPAAPRAADRPPVKPKPRPERRTRLDDSGPDLPWPCWMIRMHAAGKTRAQLEAEGRANGISLTPKQRRQAAACLSGR